MDQTLKKHDSVIGSHDNELRKHDLVIDSCRVGFGFRFSGSSLHSEMQATRNGLELDGQVCC